MKATDFDFSNELRFNPEKGITSFRNTRLVIFDTNAIGLLRNNIIKQVGMENARRLFLRFGYMNGYADFMHIKMNYEFDSETDLIASGPVLRAWEGVVGATPKEIVFDHNKQTFFMRSRWINSYEAEQHLSHNPISDEPVCWSLAGYASGYATAFFGSPLIAMEVMCVGKGDEYCEVCIQPPAAWNGEANSYVDALKDYFPNA